MTTDLELFKTINWQFIAELEGKQQLHGYVPTKENGRDDDKSGVTIATGFDIGQRDVTDLLDLELSKELVKKLYPYLGLRDEVAWNYLKDHPLEITLDEACELDLAMKRRVFLRLARYWKQHAGTSFVTLPSEAQTVLFSLAWNFGEALHKVLPDTFRIALACAKWGTWGTLYHRLMNFPSKNKELVNRRKLEAQHLRPLVPQNEL